MQVLFRDYSFIRLSNLKRDKINGYWKWFAEKVALESCATLSPLFFLYSLEYAQTRLANDVKASYSGPSHLHKGERQFNGLFDNYKKTLKSYGIAGLCRGFGVSCIGCIFVHGLFVGLHDALKPLFDRRSGSKDKLSERLMLDGSAIVGAKFATYPFDTVRRRMMMCSGEAAEYENSWDAFTYIIKNEGAESL